jgi:hypothetical protein
MTKRLTELERIAFAGVLARNRELAPMLDQLERDRAALATVVERRLRLKPGAIGTSHVLNTDTGEVLPAPKQT